MGLPGWGSGPGPWTGRQSIQRLPRRPDPLQNALYADFEYRRAMATLDLRLLSVFDQIMRKRSVSQAAQALELGQPVVSIALARLREHFGDPLFVRVGNAMQPTPLAQALQQPMREALSAVDRVLSHRLAFDPAHAQRNFRICMTDISQLVLLPDLLESLRRIAPGVRLEILPLSDPTARLLEEGDADLALGFMPQLEAGFYQQVLFQQRYVCMASVHHPRLRRTLSRAQYEAEEHAVVTNAGAGHRVVDREIERQGITRRVALTVPSFLGVALVAERTELLVTIPQRLADVLEGRGRYRVFPVPFELPEFNVKQHWHERYHHDPGNLWLRALISSLLSERQPRRGRAST